MIQDHLNETFSSSNCSEETPIIIKPNQQDDIFSDDICYEIISLLSDNPWFLIQNCSLISKQFLNVIKERSKLVITFKKRLVKERVQLLRNSQFINNIVDIQLVHWVIPPLIHVNFMTEMKQLTTLGVCHNEIGVEGARFISKLKQLIELDISYNQIGSEGAKFIGKMNQLISLNIKGNLIASEGVKSISEMKQLSHLILVRIKLV